MQANSVIASPFLHPNGPFKLPVWLGEGEDLKAMDTRLQLSPPWTGNSSKHTRCVYKMKHL
jgi:hypothetical protein